MFCVFALIAPAYGQEIFVPRELKAVAVHPPKTKEVVRRAEPVTPPEVKAPPAKEPIVDTGPAKSKVAKADVAPAKTEKPELKEKSAPAREQKATAVTVETNSKKVADATKEKEKVAKDKSTKLEPAEGLVIFTVGATFVTTTFTEAEVVDAPRLSVATAVSA